MGSATADVWGAHATRVLARRPAERTFSAFARRARKDGFGGSPKPARGSRALPRWDCRAFTLIELLIVMSIIVFLAGLVLATSSYVQKKGARSRAEAEIAAISAALESYKADNGVYPTRAETDALKANSTTSNSDYVNAGKFLYIQLAGDADGDPTTANNGKNYLSGALKPNMLSPNPPGAGTYIRDPFGNCYGYATVKSSVPNGPDGYNPTFDLWSTGGVTPPVPSDQSQWIKNW